MRIQWSDDAKSELVLKDGCYFVFGGDAGDKRDGTIRFVKLMVKLKQRYPDRVFLLVGNRDANKLRFLSELTEHDLHSCLPPLPPGVTGALKDCRQYIKELAVKQGAAQNAEDVPETLIMEMNTMANRLRWILDCTMGSAGDFEFRRQELALLAGKAVGDIDDAAVVASFYHSVADDDGFMRLYMQLGQLAVVIDCTLFVHGGVYGVFDKTNGIQSCVGLVPRGDDLSDQRTVEDREDWLLQLNDWMASQVSACIKSPAYTADRSSRAGQALFLYGSYSPHPSVIMARMLDDASMPLPVPEHVASKLKKWGLHRVVCGHTPHGNAPTIFASHGVEVLSPLLILDLCAFFFSFRCLSLTLSLSQIVMADTSFSDMSSKDRPTDNRGVAANEILICGPVLHVHGNLQDGEVMDFVTVTGRELFPPSVGIFNRSTRSSTLLERVQGDKNIGLPTKDGYFVKSAIANGRYSLCKVSGYKYEYKRVDAAELPSLF